MKCNQKNVWGPAAGHSKVNKQARLVETKVCFISGASVAQSVKNLPAMQETQVRFLGWEDPLEKEMATHSNILAWIIPRTEEPGRLQSMGSQESDRTLRLNNHHQQLGGESGGHLSKGQLLPP